MLPGKSELTRIYVTMLGHKRLDISCIYIE